MDVNLPPKLVRFVEAQVASGRYSDADDVVADALRRIQESAFADPETSAGLVEDALRLAAQTQREALDLLQNAAGGGDIRQDLAEYSSSVMNRTLDLLLHVPIARDVEQRVRSSLDSMSSSSSRSAEQTRALRQGLENTSAALNALTTVLDTIGTATRTKSQ